MAKRDELDAFCEEIHGLVSLAGASKEGRKLWAEFFDRWFLCRFRHLAHEMNVHLEIDDSGHAAVYVYSQQQCSTDSGQKHEPPKAALPDLIASYAEEEDCFELEELAEILHRQIDKGIALARSRVIA
jgi:hypothetical protein